MPLTASATYSAHQLTPAFDGEDAIELPFTYTENDFYEAGRLMAVVTATGKLAVYDDGANDGTQTWKGIINKYDVTTDADGNVTFGHGPTAGDWGQVYQNAPCYVSGWFRTEDLVGLDTNGIADCAGARLVYGDTTTGLLRVP